MNTDEVLDLQNPRPSKLLFRQETEQILNCCFSVINEIGPGLNEKVYENALAIEFKLPGIVFDKQRRFQVLYKGEHVGEFILDLIAFDSVVVDTKVIDHVTDHERRQMLNYLRITKRKVGLIINFKKPRLEWERVAF